MAFVHLESAKVRQQDLLREAQHSRWAKQLRRNRRSRAAGMMRVLRLQRP